MWGGSLVQGRRSRTDQPNLGQTKNHFIYGQSLVFSENNFVSIIGRTNNCQIEVLLKWLDESCTPSASLVVGRGIVADDGTQTHNPSVIN